MLLQSKTLSLNPAKKAALTLRRPFGSETVDLQPAPVKAAPVHENSDVPTELEAPATEAVTSSQNKVQCVFAAQVENNVTNCSGIALLLPCYFGIPIVCVLQINSHNLLILFILMCCFGKVVKDC